MMDSAARPPKTAAARPSLITESRNMFKELDTTKAYRLLNHGPVVLITTSDAEGRPNIMTLSWKTTVNSEPSFVAVCVGSQAYSQRTILDTKEFAINVPDISLLKKVVYCGGRSGKNENKFETAGLTQMKSKKIAAPKIAECFANIECRVARHEPCGDVVMFSAEVLYCEVREDTFDDYLKTGIAKTIHHLGGSWFVSPGERFKA